MTKDGSDESYNMILLPKAVIAHLKDESKLTEDGSDESYMILLPRAVIAHLEDESKLTNDGINYFLISL